MNITLSADKVRRMRKNSQDWPGNRVGLARLALCSTAKRLTPGRDLIREALLY
jgi:hypothetical protein